MNFKQSYYSFLIVTFIFLSVVTTSCEDDDDKPVITNAATPYDLKIPMDFPPMDIPSNNLTTEEGVELGRKLFYDPILSGDSTQSCGSCHNQSKGFTDNGKQFSTGIDGSVGTRNSMALINLGWGRFFFWDGRDQSLEAQAKEPVTNPIEMHDTWPNAISKLINHSDYPMLFKRAFNIDSEAIDSTYVAKAIAQFERTLISGNSKFDQKMRGEATFTAQERLGESVFFTEKGDCFHCHGTRLFTDNVFHNNGLQETIEDPGLGGITGKPSDMGLMRTPTLRNIAVTGPYMHDGSIETLEEVVEFYNSGIHQNSPNVDVLMLKANRPEGQLNLTSNEKEALVAFLHTLTDSTFLQNPDFAPPQE